MCVFLIFSEEVFDKVPRLLYVAKNHCPCKYGLNLKDTLSGIGTLSVC